MRVLSLRSESIQLVTAAAEAVILSLRTTFEHQVERRLGCTMKAGEARFLRDLRESAFSRLGSKPSAYLLRQ